MTPETDKKPPLRATISWILYDLANTAYSMNIVSFYFSTWIVIELGMRDIYVSAANSISMFLVAITMPVLGDYSDHVGRKLPLLAIFTFTCILGTAVMGIAGTSIRDTALLLHTLLVLYLVTNYAYQGGLVFYNALMPDVSTPKTLGRVSGYGVAIGYMGSIIGLAVAGIFADGKIFGYAIPGMSAKGAQAAFLPTAGLFFVFAIPIFLFVKESSRHEAPQRWTLVGSYRKVLKTLADTKKHPGLLRFLIAKLFYEDGIQTVIIYMAVFTQAVMGLARSETNKFFIIVIPSAILGSAFCGIMTDHYGPKKTLFTVILLWIVTLGIVIVNTSLTVFWILGAIIGALLGSTWTAARPLLITLVPRENLGEFFGLYSLSGKVAAIVGPFIWSLITYKLDRFGQAIQYKSAIGAMALIMLIGLLILRPVPDFHSRIKGMKR